MDHCASVPHSDHPLRHYDRTCPACNAGVAGIPAGYVLVPLEPTPAMFAADAPEDERPDDFGTMKYRRGIWNAMLRAARAPA